MSTIYPPVLMITNDDDDDDTEVRGTIVTCSGPQDVQRR